MSLIARKQLQSSIIKIRDSVLIRMGKAALKAVLAHLRSIATLGYILCGSSFIPIVPIGLLGMVVTPVTGDHLSTASASYSPIAELSV